MRRAITSRLAFSAITAASCLVAMLAGGSASASPSASLLDPLHGYCSVGCIDTGSNSPTAQDPITGFGFTVSPGPNSGDLLLEVLVPTNDTQPSSVSVTGTASGSTSTAFNATPWSSGDLDAYLGISASPNNPIGAFAGMTDTGDTTSTAFDVYQIDLGSLTLQDPSNPNVSPLENLSGLPTGSYVVAFLNEGTAGSPDWIATANSGAILETGQINTTLSPVPEPATVLLFGAGLFAFANLAAHRRRKFSDFL